MEAQAAHKLNYKPKKTFESEINCFTKSEYKWKLGVYDYKGGMAFSDGRGWGNEMPSSFRT